MAAEKRWDQALSRAQKLVAVWPQSARPHFYLGNIYFATNRLNEAADEFTTVVRLMPRSIPGWQNLAICDERLGRNEQTKAALQQLLQLDPNNALAKSRLGAR